MSDASTTKLIAAYDQYVGLLESELAMLVPVAFAHGWRSPQERIDRGIELRAEIEKLRAELSPEPDPRTTEFVDRAWPIIKMHADLALNTPPDIQRERWRKCAESIYVSLVRGARW